MQTLFEAMTCARLHDIDETHVGTIQVSEEVNDAAWQQNTKVDLSDQSCLFSCVPVLDGSNMLYTILTAVCSRYQSSIPQ